MKSTAAKTSVTAWESFQILFNSNRGFFLVNLVNFGDGIAYFGILNLLTRFLGTDVGMSDQATGFAVSTFTGLVTLVMFFGGFVSDRLGVRHALSFSLFLLLIGRLCLVASPDIANPILFAWLGIAFMAVGNGILQPALYAGAKEYTDERTATLGFSFIYAIMNLGIALEGFFSPYVRSSDPFLNLGGFSITGLGLGISGVFWMCIIITSAILLSNFVFFRKSVEANRSTPLSVVDSSKTLFVRLKELPIFDTRFLFFIFVLLPVRTLFAHQWLTMPDYIFRTFDETVSAKYEWINGMINPLIIVLFVPLFAVLTRRIHVINMMIIGTSVSAVSTFLLVSSPNLGLLISYIVIFSLGEALWSSRFYEYIAQLAPVGKVGAYMGLAGIPWFLAKWTTGLYSGSMLEAFIPKSGLHHPGMLWFIYGCIACITPIGLLIGKGWVLKKRIA